MGERAKQIHSAMGNGPAENWEDRLTRVGQEIDRCNAQKIQYYEAYRSGEISRDDFIQRKASLVSRISDLQSKREKIETERAQSQREADACRSAYRELEEYLSASDLSGDRLKAKMYEAISRVVVFSNHHIEIRWKFEDLFSDLNKIERKAV